MIEIEKKFLLDEQQKAVLLDGAREAGARSVEDSYYDTDTFSLSSNDLWLRKRDGVYELKAPLEHVAASDAITNRYDEITDLRAIAKRLGFDPESDLDASLKRAGAKKFITVLTERISYEKQGFLIDIDAATYLDSTYTYDVAEVELLVSNESEIDSAEKRIIAFAKQLGLVTDQVVLGKVVSFVKEMQPERYEALVRTGVVKS